VTTALHTGFRTATVGEDWTAWDVAGRLVVTDPWTLERARTVVAQQLAELGAIVGSRSAARRSVADGGWAAQRHLIGPFPYGLDHGGPATVPHLVLPLPARRRRRRTALRLGPGPSLRAWLVQRCAEAVAAETMCGALVAIGGDVATSGLAPAGGWRLELPGGAVALDGGAVSTIDITGRMTVAATGRTVAPHWRTVTLVAANGPAASAACAGTLLRGAVAPDWLESLGLAARLTDVHGGTLDVGRWPGRDREHSDSRQ
jgi:hypothetical protein